MDTAKLSEISQITAVELESSNVPDIRKIVTLSIFIQIFVVGSERCIFSAIECVDDPK